ncbi:hypothetical protein FCH00_023140 [Klebsiella pneumoniae]|nr:hypothetical protein FCH00_023140 [Klebsiella pneumoniae]
MILVTKLTLPYVGIYKFLKLQLSGAQTGHELTYHCFHSDYSFLTRIAGGKRCYRPAPFLTGERPFPEVKACGRVGKEKGAADERQPLHKGASGMSDQRSPEKAGYPPPPGCYLPLDS